MFWISIGFILLISVYSIAGLIQHWDFTQETRQTFLIERFGFAEGGEISIKLRQKNIPTEAKGEIKIVFQHADDVDRTLFLDESPIDECKKNLKDAKMVIDLKGPDNLAFKQTIGTSEHAMKPGFYFLYFSRCEFTDPLDFAMDATLVNPGPNYLSAGDAMLPQAYMWFSLFFTVAFILWVRTMRKNAQQTHHIHRIMGVLVLLKTLSLFAEAMRFSYMKLEGDALTSWNVLFYIFVCLKGTILFVVILLIGTGWSFVKPFLSNRDKKTIFVVMILQIINNIAFIALSEADTGTRAWMTWKQILICVDLACCFAILMPIIWSMRHLKEAAATDGKANANLKKLSQFRSFYLVVISYLYFSHIVVQVFGNMLPFNLTWLRVIFAEGIALVFYTNTGMKFRPLKNNPYIPLRREEDPMDEFGLEDDEMELGNISASRSV